MLIYKRNGFRGKYNGYMTNFDDGVGQKCLGRIKLDSTFNKIRKLE